MNLRTFATAICLSLSFAQGCSETPTEPRLSSGQDAAPTADASPGDAGAVDASESHDAKDAAADVSTGACTALNRAEAFSTSRVNWKSGGHAVDVGGVSRTGAFTSKGGDPSATRATAEVTWNEGGVEQRIYMYFRSDGTNWFAYEIRTYNATGSDWNYYKKGAPYFTTPQGGTFTSPCVTLTSDDGEATLRLKDFSLKVDIAKL